MPDREAIHPFIQTISVVGPIVGGIVFLTLFFKLMGWIDRKFSRKPNRISFKGVLNERTLSTVHLGTGVTFENVKIIGFTDAPSGKGMFPHELRGMVILEHLDGRRTLIQAKNIRMIEVAAKAA